MDLQLLKKEVITFLVIELILTIILYTMAATGTFPDMGLFVFSIMWSPSVSAFITSLYFQKNLRGFGWGWGKTRYQLLSYILPIFLALIVYSTVWLTGLGDVNPEKFTEAIARFTGAEIPHSFVVSFLIFASFTFLFSFLSGAGEEFGWRGFFVPRLFKLTGFTKTCLISGAVWAVWHYPGFFLIGYTSGLPAWYTIPCFTILIFSGTIIFNWITLKSGSVWTAVILHAAHNLFIQGLFDRMTVDTGSTLYFTTEFGIGLAIIYSIAAYYFWRRRGELESNI